jgi:hypothetical protein
MWCVKVKGIKKIKGKKDTGKRPELIKIKIIIWLLIVRIVLSTFQYVLLFQMCPAPYFLWFTA